MSNSDWVPTAKLRWVKRHDRDGVTHFTMPVLQVWYSQDVPGYMRRDAEGEWRDVVVEQESAA